MPNLHTSAIGWQELLTAIIILWAMSTLGRILIRWIRPTATDDAGQAAGCGGCSGCAVRTTKAPLVVIDPPTRTGLETRVRPARADRDRSSGGA